jgi:hypothetical protein
VHDGAAVSLPSDAPDLAVRALYSILVTGYKYSNYMELLFVELCAHSQCRLEALRWTGDLQVFYL